MPTTGKPAGRQHFVAAAAAAAAATAQAAATAEWAADAPEITRGGRQRRLISGAPTRLASRIEVFVRSPFLKRNLDLQQSSRQH